MKSVYLVKVGDSVRPFSSEAEMVAAGFKTAHKIITEEEFNSNGCYARIVDGDIVIGRTKEELQAEKDHIELEELKAEVASRDYRALKAVKLGVELDSIYPGESAWYQGKLDRIHELETSLGLGSPVTAGK